MKLTKYQHACFVLEKKGTCIIVDPGNITHDFIEPERIDAIIVTHEHLDHFDEVRIRSLLNTHPKATIIAHENISGRFTDHKAISARPGEPLGVGSFSVQFFGGTHAPIANGVQTPPNLGILIDDRLYYPGDSFTVPEGKKVKELLIPVSAPWMKISEAVQFLLEIRPQYAFPTHDGILSSDGKRIVDRLLGTAAGAQDIHYKRIDGSIVELS